MQSYGSHRAQQEREMRGYQWLQRGIVAAVIAGGVIAKPQEQPRAGTGTFSSGVQGPNVASGIGSIYTRQEQPYHPRPYTWGVRVVEPEQQGHIAVLKQQLPDLGKGTLGAGIQGPDVRPPITDTAITRLELPREGRGTLQQGVFPQSTRPPIIDTAITKQERPREGYSFTQLGVQGPDVEVPVKNTFFARQQEYPPPGKGITTWFGVQGPNVASGIGSIYIVQQLPSHPGPFTWNFIVTLPGDMLLGQTTVIVGQQFPDLGKVVSTPGVQGPDVQPPIKNFVFARQQEQPPPGIGTLTNSVQSVNIERSRTDYTFTRQQYPDLGRGMRWAGVQGPDVEPPGTVGRIFTRQEQPRLGVGWTWRQHIVPAAVVAQATQNRLFARPQETPLSTRRVKFSPGVQGPDVIPPGRRVIQGSQEQTQQYGHPRPFTHWHTQIVAPPPVIIPHGTRVFVKQELPFHPGFFSRGVLIPSNAWPFFTGKIPPLQENLTKDMLGKNTQNVFYADPGFDRQIITSINYPQGQYYVVGWTPIGGVKYPIGNMYNRDLVQPARPIAKWFHEPDLVGGWITEHMNLTRDYVTLSNQTSFMIEPLDLHVNDLLQQLYPVGLTPIGMNVTRRGILGVKPYG